MSTEAEEFFGIEEPTDCTGFELDPSEDLEENVREYEDLLVSKKLLEIQLKELSKNLDDCTSRLRAKVGDRKKVRAMNGWTMAWVHKARKGYTVQDKEWDAFEVRSPF